MPPYVPRQGEFVALSFDPQSGHEQRRRRFALVISKRLFNSKTGLAIVCPVTNTKRDFPFQVPIPAGGNVTGFIMVERVKSVDFPARDAQRIEQASDELTGEVLSMIDACIY